MVFQACIMIYILEQSCSQFSYLLEFYILYPYWSITRYLITLTLSSIPGPPWYGVDLSNVRMSPAPAASDTHLVRPVPCKASQ